MTTFETPVVLIVFNRPDRTRELIARLRLIRPSNLLVVADGARASRPGELEKVEAVMGLFSEVDWPCEIQTNVSNTNLGCKERIQTGLDWAFGLVDEAIVLEDDCLPDESFFWFCKELLEKYRLNPKVGMISGNNFHFGLFKTKTDFYFTNFPHIWGWATWSRAWKLNEPNIETWPEVRGSDFLWKQLRNRKLAEEWSHNFDGIHEVDTWDVQWVYSIWKNSMLSIAPNVNLVSNNGFGEDATHTKTPDFNANQVARAMRFPLRGPQELRVNRIADFLEVKIRYFKLVEGFIRRGFRRGGS